jgi:HAE1 family hydrophobic/amphiphilic exporter-1
MANFFIRRPIVAIVIAIVLSLLGLAVLQKLSIEQYPELSPPMIRVEANLPGASSETVLQSLATPVERDVNGVDNMIYMKSTNSSDGRMRLDVSFQVGMDRDMANVLTQNRVSQAQSRLPQEAIQQGVTVKKINPSILMIVSLYSPSKTWDAEFLNNYAMINIRDELLRVPGVSTVDLTGGAEYGMRLWLRPDRLASLELTPADVIAAVKEQNLIAPAGQVGAAPSPPGQQFTYTVKAPGRFETPEEFENIVLRESAVGGAVVRLKDVARVELGSENYRSFAQSMVRDSTGAWQSGPSASLMVYLLPGANQLVSSEQMYARLEELAARFPADMRYEIVYDTTPAVEASIHEIVKTLVEAFILVSIVVFVFLQSFRATIIPLLTVPVSLLATFIFFPLLGFSINTLTMFGLVLAIGIVVDDAIVVVEAVMHHIEHGMNPRDATFKAMSEVSGPVVAIALILSAVFVPVALLGGLTGRLYQQFALTIAISVLISAFLALSLAPALTAMVLKEHKPAGGPLGAFFRGFNRLFEVTTGGYVKLTRPFVRRSMLAVGVVIAAAGLSGVLVKALPGGFVPEEDQGIFLVSVQLPPASSAERTAQTMAQLEAILRTKEDVTGCTGIGGMEVVSSAFSPEYATYFCELRPWEERGEESQKVFAITTSLAREFAAAIPSAFTFPILPPTIPGFGASGGFNFLLQDRTGTLTVAELGQHTATFMTAARQRPELAGLFTTFNPNSPQVGVQLDREKARSLGVPINDVFAAMQASLGGVYVNDFNRFGRLYRVYVQAEPEFRQKPNDIGQFYVRSRTSDAMIPLSTLVSIDQASGAELSMRYNLFRSVEITGRPAPGYTSAQAMAALEEIATTLPAGMGYEFSGLSYQEKTAPPAGPTFVLAIVFVFLLLAALYESWKLPWAVLLETPLVALGAFFGTWLMGYDNNVFVQVGLIMLVGLAAKNAILIVEFAKAQHEAGKSIEEAALESARLRFRPILMTAFAFILGVVPLMLANGAGAGAQTRMGTSVFWGMLIATLVGVFIIPGLFAMVERMGRKKKAVASDAVPVVATPTHAAEAH